MTNYLPYKPALRSVHLKRKAAAGLSSFLLLAGIRLTLCQRQYLENSRSPRQDQEISRCRPDGSFEEVQCLGVTCFCVDPENGRAVKDTNINTLFGEPSCGDSGRDRNTS